MTTFNDIWTSQSERDWNTLFHRYWSLIKVDNVQVEYSLNRLDPERISKLDENSWYEFLHDEYFFWKYTAKNRLATTRKHLRRYVEEDDLYSLNNIRIAILDINPKEIGESLRIACEIRGLGVAGASGLLSLIYPEYFATVDQFVVKALREVEEQRSLVEAMNPEGLSIKDGVLLTEILRGKATEMDSSFGSNFWTPRTLEMALWAYRS